ncbi:TonB-dependent receptor [Ignavibacterium sp.]|uniref:TonB-dependent receptor n=1 Tax=Ignavibacterium sp. TaxID=2651167 RepID=UPI0021FAC457|nr:TonB-dependent receptor [Ignavibacterium sp.]BDQ02136.1 MAG: ligand-gated channel [Ignavibacterium sp.]
MQEYFLEYHLRFLKVIFLSLFITFSSLADTDTFILEGIVLDAENSEPISNAAVQLIGTDIYTTTKSDGTFSLQISIQSNFRIKITHLAYQEKLVDIKFQNELDKKLIVYLIPKIINLSTVVVSEHRSTSLIDEIRDYSNILRGRELQRNLSQTLASTLKNESGLSVRSMGPAPSRPVYRGLGQDRILISEDGMKTVDLSATSPDHAVTIEPFTSDRIEVLRGPKILTQTSSTVGGIVNVSRNEIPQQIHNTYHLTVGGYAETVNKGYLGAIQSEIPINPLAIRFELSRRNTSDLSTPDGLLKNSSSKNFNSSLGLSYINDLGYSGVAYRLYDLSYGIPGGFIGAHPNGVKIDITKKQIHFDSNIKFLNDSNYFKLSYKNIYYRHKEFEFSGRIGSEFRIITNLANIEYNHIKLFNFDEGIFGISLEHRDFEIGGFVFTPPTKSLNISAYVFEEINFGKANLNFAARYSFDDIKPKVEKLDSKIGSIRGKTFNNLSLSASILYQLSDIVFIGSNISRSTRVPTIEELFSEGPHLAAYSYEVGNPDLSSESGIGTEVFVYHKFEKLNFNLNVFYNNFESFIIPRNSGEINYQTFLPIFKTFGVAALLYGFDGSFNWNFYDGYYLSSSFTYTKGEFRENHNSLPQIPPFKGTTGIQYKADDLQFGLGFDWAFKQNNIDIFEQPTAGYIIFNSFIQYLFYIDESVNSVTLNVDNIFNKSYRNHLSRIKSILPEAGFNIRLIYKLMI